MPTEPRKRSLSGSSGLLDHSDAQRLEQSRLDVPPFLFRAYSSINSLGINNDGEMKPVSSSTYPRRSLFAGSVDEIRKMLYAHLSRDGRVQSDFVSWSSSLLWTLAQVGRMLPPKAPEIPPDIEIAILDIRNVDDMAIFPATTLMEVFNIPDTNRVYKDAKLLSKDDFISEFLFYGPLHNNSNGLRPCYKSVSVERLRLADATDFMFEATLNIGDHKSLTKYVEKLGAKLETPKEELGNEAKEDLDPIVHAARLYGSEFEYVMVVAIAAIRFRDLGSELRDLRQFFEWRDIPPPKSRETFENEDFKWRNVDRRLMEVRRMYQALEWILRPDAGTSVAASTPSQAYED